MKTIADIEMDRLSGVPLETCYEELLKIAYRLSNKKEKREYVPSKDAEELYAMYPRKVGKPAALKAIDAALKKTSKAELIKAIGNYMQEVEILGIEAQYIPHPATWFNQERWNDQRSTTTGSSLVRIDFLKARIRNSPAFPGGPRYVDYTTPETRQQLKQDIEELERLCPGFELRTLR